MRHEGLEKASSAFQRLRDSLRRSEEQLEERKIDKTAIEEAIIWVTGVINGLQQETHQRISKAVSRCLKFVFGAEAYSFNIVFVAKGKVQFELERDGEKYDLEDVGGGVIDIVSFALRTSVLMTTNHAPVLILDEPFRFVSKEYREKVCSLLNLLSEEFKLQIIMITHAPELVTGKVIDLGEL